MRCTSVNVRSMSLNLRLRGGVKILGLACLAEEKVRPLPSVHCNAAAIAVLHNRRIRRGGREYPSSGKALSNFH